MNGDEPIENSEATCEFCEETIYRRKLDGRWKHKRYRFYGHRATPRAEPKIRFTKIYEESPVETGSDIAENLVSFAAGVLSTSREEEPVRTSNYVEPSQDWPHSSPIELEAPEPSNDPAPSSYDCGSSDSSSSCDSSSSDSSSSSCDCGSSDS